MTSLPPSQCCIGGSLHEGETQGELTKFGDIPVYVSYPPDKSTHNAILFLSDIFGLALVNSKLIADLFAANGYLVVMPDLFQGDPVPVDHSPSFQIMDWLQGHLPPQTDPIVTATLREMRERLGCQRIGGVGYCYGGKYVVRYLHPGQLDVGFVAHPTFIEPDELKAIEGPLSISASAQDNLFPPEKRHESETILAQLDVPYQINIFSDVEHGFAVRCDLNKTRHRFAKEQSFSQGVTWFNQYLKK
ncbi:dienelactone hydrolase family protein [Aspergillus japonicus CBS 114.51]|uniref:Hydrolase pyvD n=2 Tax=Aspergillus TaxID=5052 RepID=PYVD_ASPV1|nr:dienelactone hydrolase family protein [Aspergillus japonicus CBS 114.51]A0A2V5GSC6.1 RecName: Full=Hydrolase pyvD; AltName: Full=Pyranoviolin A biosynthesis cluster protein D [Aspergillus violaceofuscus CBS 115571]PYI13691.1 dienelactone hydrolase family protein [Aspergillus violaceofuscus CBS 115571]RAH84210.1 dienelactone hydrolase family protein [Aspergillus japonicus CBS 114.51]FAA01294.1 TPA: alpha/beta hydrolase PyvD [Aspergillus violaceofuscus]